MIKGLQQTLKAMDTFEIQIQEDIKDVVEEYTQKILLEARQLLNAGGNQYATTYGSQTLNTNFDQFLDFRITNNGYSGEVFIEAQASELMIYIEFGTGMSAAGYVPTLPPEMQLVALRFFVNGKGTLLKRPFLLPSFFNNESKALYAMRDALKKYGVTTIVLN